MTTNWQQPPGGPPPSQPNNQSPNSGKGKRFAVVGVLLVVIAGLAAGAGLFMANRDADTVADDARYVLTETVATEPVFEPRDARGPDPFFPLEVQLVAFQEEQEAEIREQASELLEGAAPGQQVEVPEFDVAALDEAVKTGLYGGTEENTCDPERLISFLYANPDLGEAWALVQGIEFVEIADYIRSLDVRILAEDTNVLNHGFNPDTGAPYEIDAVLAAGTAVLVDKDGDIRTRCYCGNPIKPKPPEHMPPRCVVWLENIYVEPSGNERRENAVRDVLLTGRETTVGGAVWIEVKWGNADDQRGWVRSDNLRKHYCPPEKIEWQCPGPDDVPVWAGPDNTDQVGWHTGTLHTPAGNADIFGPVLPVGGPNPTVINGFMLIHFTQANNAQNSAWIELADLDQDEENCFRIPMCVNTEGPVWERGGGAIIDAGGVMQVEFTGRFVTDFVTHAEVRLVEQGGTEGWITNFYTALEDTECPETTYECVTDYGKDGAIVYRDSVGNDHIGHVYNATVTLLDVVQDGRVFIEMATPGGPQGWIDEERFTADLAKCVPWYECYTTTGPAFTEFATEGDMIPAQAAMQIGIIGKRAHGEGGDPNTYTRIQVGVERYWIPEHQVLPVLGVDEDCQPPRDEDCPTYDDVPGGVEELAQLRFDGEARPIEEEIGPERPTITECCVTALYETPDTSSPVMGLVFPVQVTVDGFVVVDDGFGGEEVWFITDTGDYFMAIHVAFAGDCQLGECPAPFELYGLREGLEMNTADGLLTRVEEPRRYDPTPQGDTDDCCVNAAFTGIESGIQAEGDFPRFVDVASGPHAPAPGWYMTTDGAWFSSLNVLDAQRCQPIECPNPMVPGLYDAGDLRRDTEDTVALALLYPGDTAECCVDGEIYSGPGFDQALGAPLTDPTSVVVIDIEGEWYQVVIQDFVAWVHVSQFLDLGDCDGDDLPCDNLQDAIDAPIDQLVPVVECCISLRVRTVIPTQAGPGDWVTIDPPVEGVFVDVVEHDGQTWYEFDTDEHGTVWARADNLVNASACDQDVECPGSSLVAQAIVDDFENGPYTLYSCCVAVNVAGAATTYKVVTLTGETMDDFGVISYETTDGEWILETDFVFGGDCEQTCEDGQTIVTNLEDCPPPVRCPDGQTVAAIDDCPPPGVQCPNGQTVVSLSDCPPPGVQCPDGQTAATVADCPAPTGVLCPDGTTVQTLSDCPAPPCPDRDQDGVCDADDNCQSVPNPNQDNNDGDTIGDACDNCPFLTNGFQDDSDGDGIGDDCERPDCPQDRVLDNGQCCPTGSSADGSECFCQSGAEVRPGDTCPPPCPEERQLFDGRCCPAGTTAGSVDCFCPDQSLPVAGVGCTKECPNGDRIPVAETCPLDLGTGPTQICTSDRLRGDGVCCPPGSIAWQSNTVSAIVWTCLEPEG